MGGWGKRPSSTASLMGSAPQHKGAFQAPSPSALPWLNGKCSDSGEEMSQLPNFSWGQTQAHPPPCPTVMKVQMGWKAPVPQASRWVWLWGCETRTKLAHSICRGRNGCVRVREKRTVSLGSKASCQL